MSIRATRNGFLDLVARQTARNSVALRRVEEQATSGLVMNRPSDLPESVRLVQSLNASVADQAVWQDNAEAAGGVLTAMDEALARAGDVLIRAREIAVAMAGDTVGAEARAVAAVEVRGLQEAMLDAANTEFNGRHIFAGRDWENAPFDATGAYLGDTTAPESRIGPDRWVRTGLDGGEVFAGTADVFGTLEALATALEADDATGVSDTLDDLDTSSRALNVWRGEVGSEMNASEDAVAVSENLEALFSQRLSDEVSADPVETYARLAELRSAYDQTLQVAASSSNLSLFDLLK